MKYVIIGNSAAAIGTIQGIRLVDKEGQIVVISDENYHTYSRPLISYWLKGAVTEENMRYRDEDFYEKNDVDTLFGTRVTKINPAAKTVTIENGNEISYDKLMIAAGSKPFIPPMEGLDKVAKKFTFMTFDSAKAVKEAVTEGAKVLIVGAGLIGLKAAEALEHYGADMTVIDLADRILPSILDEDASAIMQKHIESKGVKFILGTSVKEFSENSALLNNGETVEFDMVILAVGVRPNTELAAEAGGTVNRGIVTDQKQAVNGLKDVYAAGDCTESLDITTGQQKILALLPNAFMQGEVAGQNMAGKETYYLNAIPMNAIGFFGLHIITAGSYDGEAFTETDGVKNYKKLVTKDNELKGFILMGDVKRAGIYTSLIKHHISIDECDFELLKEKPQMIAFSRGYRNEKLAGGYGNVD
ncbi:MAG: FAD-dependent oxidoreductase [Oscillospiraceae bacterium]|nr:FAD-dependent oxidoreductase [Oscillospiraceae bacterium]